MGPCDRGGRADGRSLQDFVVGAEGEVVEVTHPVVEEGIVAKAEVEAQPATRLNPEPEIVMEG